MAQSPITQKSNLTSFVIISNEKEISSVYKDQIIEVRVTQEINRISEAEIFMRDGDPSEQKFPVADSGIFIPGAKISIQMGYEGQNQPVFSGVVVKMNITVDEVDGSRLRVFCKDEALKTTITRKNAIYLNQKDSQVVEQIAATYNLQTTVAATNVTYKELVQFYASDWDFMISRAEVNGMFIYSDSGNLVMSAPKVSDEPALVITYGFDVHEFDCELEATYQLAGTQSNAWNMTSQAVIKSTGATPELNEQGNISASDLAKTLSVGNSNLISGTGLAQEAIQAWADAALLKAGMSRFNGTMLFQGTSLAKVNSTIQLAGFSNRFNGNGFISGVSHQIDGRGWMTEVKIGLSEKWYADDPINSGPMASGLLPGVQGLQIGVVKKTDEDPDGQFRVQVQIPILAADANLVWARLSTFYAGNAIGAYFMPEIGDEVILGFLNEDPNFAIILGSLYSQKIPAPEKPDAKNTIKTIITSSKLQVKFDDAKKEITLLTPAGNTIVLSDADGAKGIKLTDQNKNFMEMNDKGININSASDITITAAQNLTIHGNNVTVKGDQGITESAPTVSVTGEKSATFAGNGECNLSSDGQMSVKGLKVMIN